jgi:N utilization substance protein A
VTEQEESEHRQAEFENRTKLFVDALNLDEVVGQLLASEGFNSVQELAIVDEKELAGIEGFDEDTAQELQARARDYLAKEEADLDAARRELGVADDLKEFPNHDRHVGEIRRRTTSKPWKIWQVAPRTISSAGVSARTGN